MISEWNILEKISPMLVGEELQNAMEVIPDYSPYIKEKSQAERLMALNNIYSLYYPSTMGSEIYAKIYLAMTRSLQRKESKLAIKQRNLNGNAIRRKESYGGIIGGSDCFSIIGSSGIGKSRSIERAITITGGENVIELENPFCKIIPIINVQCPFDCSGKALLLSICKKVDEALGTNYYEMEIRARSSTNMMIVSVAQILLNHCAVLVIDEIQNLVKHKAGTQLVSMLTELLNESGISIVMVGTPEVEAFFRSVDYLARRTIGLYYGRCSYDDYFYDFCKEMWNYQYVKNKSELTESIIHYLYEHSAGTLSHVMFLFYTAQEISILNGKESIDIESLEEAYQRMSMLHIHIEPEIRLKNVLSKKKRTKSVDEIMATTMDKTVASVSSLEQECNQEEWSFMKIADYSKKKNIDMLLLLQGKLSITELEV